MTTPNTIIADLSFDISYLHNENERLHKICNLLLSVAIRSENFVEQFDILEDGIYSNHALLDDLRYAIDEAHHG